ncbi:hypothetical protein D3C81_1382000 [compost metagenome]
MPSAQGAGPIVRPQPDAQPAGKRPGWQVDEVVLPGGQHRQADQAEPDMHDCAPESLAVPAVTDPQHHQQGNVQRRCLVERLVETGQNGEQPTEHTAHFRAFERESQGPEQKATDCNQLCAEQAQRMAVQFMARQAQQQGETVQQVDRPVRHNGPGPERYMGFPGEHQAGHFRALGRVPGGKAVTGKEKRRQQQ